VESIPFGEIPALHAARLGPGQWALRHNDEVISWGELDKRSTRRAWALQGAGVQPEDLVTLSIPNSSAFYELTFALWKLGATPHVVSWRLPENELRAILDLARPRLVIASDPVLRERIGAVPPEFGLDETRQDRLPAATPKCSRAMSSGGSTGRPKIIVDHAPGLADPSEDTFTGMPVNGVVLNPGPLYHSAPFNITHAALFRGNSVVGMTRFDAEEALRLIERHQVQWVNFVPTMMLRIWRLPDSVKHRYDLSSLRRVWHMAAPMPAWLKEAWIGWLGPERIWELYGGTEGVGRTIVSGEEWLAHRGTVGRPFGSQVRILDESGEDLPAGAIGEIFFRRDADQGPSYHYIGAESRRVGEGWESLGDFGRVDEDGYLYLADRRLDLIISGGANIYPAEVEGALMAHPWVEIAVVVGLPHEDLGAVVHAIVRPSGEAGALTGEALAEFLEQRLVRYKIPRSFEFTQEELRDEAGKVRRASLREARLQAGPKAHAPSVGLPTMGVVGT